MNIVPLYDINIIRGVMMHEDILPTIIDDTWDGTAYTPDIDNEIYLGCVTDEGLIGVYRLHWITGVTLEGHAHILKAFRKNNSVKTCHAVMKWILDNVARCKKVECYVPALYPNVEQFLAICGLKIEGKSRNSFMRNGQLYDRTAMGITRDEMESVINV